MDNFLFIIVLKLYFLKIHKNTHFNVPVKIKKVTG